jgi:hypothetical protein
MSSVSPRKKKMNPKRRDLIAHLTRLAAEVRVAEELELKRREQAERRRMKEEAERAAFAKQCRAEELERLGAETAADEPYLQSRVSNLVDEQNEAFDFTQWHRYVDCNPLPDVTKERELNSFLSLWVADDEELAAAGAGSAAATAQALSVMPTVEKCHLAESVIALTQAMRGESLQWRDLPHELWYHGFARRLRATARDKLDRHTRFLLDSVQGSDTSAEEAESATVTRSYGTPSVALGLWAHTQVLKNKRAKQISFKNLKIDIDLPAALQASRTSIRVTHTLTFNPLFDEYPPDELPSQAATTAAAASVSAGVGLGSTQTFTTPRTAIDVPTAGAHPAGVFTATGSFATTAAATATAATTAAAAEATADTPAAAAELTPAQVLGYSVSDGLDWGLAASTPVVPAAATSFPSASVGAGAGAAAQSAPAPSSALAAALAAAGATAEARTPAHLAGLKLPPGFLSPEYFVSVGGVVVVEQLALPPPPKRWGSKGPMMREVASLTEPLVRVPYPAATEEGSAASVSQGPVKLSFQLPPHAVLADTVAPRLASWSAEHRAWRTDGIALLGYDAAKRTVHVQVVALAPFAVIQPRMLDFPYSGWHITPAGPGRLTLTLQTPRLTVTFLVSRSAVVLVGPRLPELSHLLNKPMEPGLLLCRLCTCGINLLPRAADALRARKTAKLPATELRAHEELATVAPLCELSSLVWNATVGASTALARYRLAPQAQHAALPADLASAHAGPAAGCDSGFPFPDVSSPAAVAAAAALARAPAALAAAAADDDAVAAAAAEALGAGGVSGKTGHRRRRSGRAGGRRGVVDFEDDDAALLGDDDAGGDDDDDDEDNDDDEEEEDADGGAGAGAGGDGAPVSGVAFGDETVRRDLAVAEQLAREGEAQERARKAVAAGEMAPEDAELALAQAAEAALDGWRAVSLSTEKQSVVLATEAAWRAEAPPLRVAHVSLRRAIAEDVAYESDAVTVLVEAVADLEQRQAALADAYMRTNQPDVKEELDGVSTQLTQDKAALAAALAEQQRALMAAFEDSDASTLLLQQNLVALLNVLRPLSFA